MRHLTFPALRDRPSACTVVAASLLLLLLPGRSQLFYLSTHKTDLARKKLRMSAYVKLANVTQYRQTKPREVRHTCSTLQLNCTQLCAEN